MKLGKRRNQDAAIIAATVDRMAEDALARRLKEICSRAIYEEWPLDNEFCPYCGSAC